MIYVHATRKLLDRVYPEADVVEAQPGTVLGNWYATPLFWRPQVALLINENTFLPLLLPLASVATLGQRIPVACTEMLAALDLDAGFIAAVWQEMREVSFAKTASRQVLGVMNQFAFQADVYGRDHAPEELLRLSILLAGTPTGPLYKRSISPDRELRAVAQRWAQTSAS